MKKILYLFLLFIAGCSTVPVEIPSASGPAIQFVRDSGFVGGACTYNAIIDESIIGQIDAGYSITRQVSPGSYKVGISNASAICPNVQMSKIVEVINSPVVFRIGITSNFQVIFDRVR